MKAKAELSVVGSMLLHSLKEISVRALTEEDLKASEGHLKGSVLSQRLFLSLRLYWNLPSWVWACCKQAHCFYHSPFWNGKIYLVLSHDCTVGADNLFISQIRNWRRILPFCLQNELYLEFHSHLIQIVFRQDIGLRFDAWMGKIFGFGKSINHFSFKRYVNFENLEGWIMFPHVNQLPVTKTNTLDSQLTKR